MKIPSFFRKRGPLVPDWKQSALDDFARWLDELDTPPPETNLEPDVEYGLVDLVEAMTALRTETAHLARHTARVLRDNEEQQRVQAARQTEQAEAQASDRKELQRVLAALEQMTRARDAERERTERRRALQMLFDTAEDVRMLQVRHNAVPIKRRWFRRSPTASSMDHDLHLLLKRIEDALSASNVRALATVGDRFDPETMSALASVRTGRVPPGAVCEVIRQGIAIDEHVQRYAEVHVEKEEQT